MRTFAYSLAICITASMLTTRSAAEPQTVTWTGWFSDSQCALARAASGIFTATNPDCARRCIEKGAAPVFISEQAKAVFTVKDYPGVIADLGYRLEVVATVDEAAKTLSIKKVTRVSEAGPACALPRKSAAKP